MELKCDLSVICNALLHDSTSGEMSWHSASHENVRELMKECIKHLILEKRSDAAKAWENSLSEVCSKIEEKLYFKATSIEQYSDPYSIISRMQAIVDDLLLSAKPTNDSRSLETRKTAPELPMTGMSATLPEVPSFAEEIALGSSMSSSLPPKPVVERAFDAVTVGTILFPHIKQVSSQGCSRVFIIKVLTYVAEYVKGKSLPSVFTFKRDLAEKWLENGKAECCAPSFNAEEAFYGGPPFMDTDSSTHWTEPGQLYTWWKNNIERKAKYRVLQDDAQYTGPDARRIQRAKWCQVIVALADVIRAHSGSGQSRANQIAAASEVYTAPPPKPSAPPVGFRGKVDPPILKPYLGVQVEELLRQNQTLFGTPLSAYPTLAHVQPLSSQFTSFNPFSVNSGANPYLSENIRQVAAATFQKMTQSPTVDVSSDKPENVFLYILFDLLSAGDSSPCIDWTEDGLSFQIKNESLFTMSVLTKNFQCLPTLASFQEYLLSFGFTLQDPSSFIYSHHQFKRNRRDLVSDIKAKLGHNGSAGTMNGTLLTTDATVSAGGIGGQSAYTGRSPAAATLSSVPGVYPPSTEGMHVDPQANWFPYMNHMTSMAGLPPTASSGYPPSSSFPYSSFVNNGVPSSNPGVPFQYNPPPYSSYTSHPGANFLSPYGNPAAAAAFGRLNPNGAGKPRMPGAMHNLPFLGMQPYGPPPMMGLPQMQQYLYHQQQMFMPGMNSPGLRGVHPSQYPLHPHLQHHHNHQQQPYQHMPRLTKDYHSLKSKKVLSAAAAAAGGSAALSGVSASQSAEQFLDGTHASRAKRAYTRRTKEDIATIRNAKAQIRQEKQEKRRERQTRAAEAKGKRGRKRKSESDAAAADGASSDEEVRRRPRSRRQRRKPQKLRETEEMASDSLESEYEPILADEEDEEDNEGEEEEQDENEQQEESGIDDEDEAAASRNSRPRRTRSKMLLKNSDKLRAPAKKSSRHSRRHSRHRRHSSRNSRATPTPEPPPPPAKKIENPPPLAKNLQSKESSADGTIMPYRASYVTGGKHRSERTSSNNLEKFFHNGEWSNYERIKPKMGVDCQTAIPDLLPYPSAEECGAANTNLVWTSHKFGGHSNTKTQQKAVGELLQNIKAQRSQKVMDIGSVTVVYISQLAAFKLCSVLDVYMEGEFDDIDEEGAQTSHSSSSTSQWNTCTVRVYDGQEDWNIPLADCYCFHERHEDSSLEYIHHSSKRVSDDFNEVLAQDEQINMNDWSCDEVKVFCSAIKKCGDNVYKIWNQNFSEEKTFREVLDFFNRIYPHIQGNKKKLINIYHRGELASAGYPDGVLDDEEDEESNEEEDEEEVEEEEDDSEGSEDGDSEGNSEGGSESDSGSSSESEGEGEAEEGNDRQTERAMAGSDSGHSSGDVQLISKPRRGRPPKKPTVGTAPSASSSSSAPNATAAPVLVYHNLLDHAKKLTVAPVMVSGAVAGTESRSSHRKRSLNAAVAAALSKRSRDWKKQPVWEDDADEDAPSEVAPELPLFCICRTIESENERYIACSVGHPDRCNGWVHLTCAGMSPTIPEETLLDIKDYICPLCAADVATDKKTSRGRKSISEKLQQIEAFTSPVYNFSADAPSNRPAANQKSGRSNNRRRSY